jgi:hypothetical protein
MTENIIVVALAVAFGSLAQEILWWYDLKAKLHTKKFKDLIGSPSYYIVTFAFIAVGFGFGIIWFYGRSEVELRDAFILGLGLPIFLKKLAATTIRADDNQKIDLGDSKLSDYLS